MANDNLLAAIQGASEGLKNVLVPYLQGNIEEQRINRLLNTKSELERENKLAEIQATGEQTRLTNKEKPVRKTYIADEQNVVRDELGNPVNIVNGLVVFPKQQKTPETTQAIDATTGSPIGEPISGKVVKVGDSPKTAGADKDSQKRLDKMSEAKSRLM